MNPPDVAKRALHLQGVLGGGIGDLRTGHLWFLTFIFVCYLLTPLLERWRPPSGRFCLALVGACVAETAITPLSGAVGFCDNTSGVLSFAIAYHVAGAGTRG